MVTRRPGFVLRNLVLVGIEEFFEQICGAVLVELPFFLFLLWCRRTRAGGLRRWGFRARTPKLRAVPTAAKIARIIAGPVRADLLV
jgi:hypothetical protein